MSNIGLNSNIYHSTRVYLDLLNDYLAELNYAKERGILYKNDKVTEFFQRINDKTKVDPEARMLRSFFNHFYNEHKKNMDREISSLIKHLNKSEPDINILKEIEELVEVLKDQCAQDY